MIIVCPACAAKYNVEVTRARKARCQCGTVFTVAPEPAPVVLPPAVPAQLLADRPKTDADEDRAAWDREQKRQRNQRALDDLSRSLDYAEAQQQYTQAQQRRQWIHDYFEPEPEPPVHNPWKTAFVVGAAYHLWTRRHG